MGTAERETIFAFLLREVAAGPANTMSTGAELVVHGTTIAKREGDRIFLTLAGFPSKLTRKRLNTLLDAMGSPKKFWQEQGRQYFGNPTGYFQNVEADQWVVIQ